MPQDRRHSGNKLFLGYEGQSYLDHISSAGPTTLRNLYDLLVRSIHAAWRITDSEKQYRLNSRKVLRRFDAEAVHITNTHLEAPTQSESDKELQTPSELTLRTKDMHSFLVAKTS
ncbi:hypothetical protein D9615_008840 [Tricholomella constricta]|uniref:Uncharacterized protein n=1 Tax=Tricholomella constricta TaxID=117010 RepID=A0A8H5GZE3_9AGAR|nr:hypothetical protein D9615_008840 [Tricholomella constricta]